MKLEYPLYGIRILDLTQLIAGPSATAMLAELGADVIKLETPSGDASRKMGQARKNGFSSTFVAYNKGKRSLSIDLRAMEGKRIANQLITSCDVSIEAFRPGVMERLGLGYEQVREKKPDIIMDHPGFATNEVRIKNRQELHDLLQDKLIRQTSQYWKDLFKSTRIIYGDVLSYSQVVE